jgi:hypothetical protein
MSARRPCPHAEDAVGWAMQALEPDVEAELSAHIPYCHLCRAEVASAEDVLGALSATSEQVTPQPHVREKLMASVAATPQTPVEEREPAGPKIGPAPVSEQASPRPPSNWSPWGPVGRTKPPGPNPSSQSRRERFVRRRQIVAAAATVLLALVGIVGILLHNSGPRQEEAQARAQQLQHAVAQEAGPGTRHALLNSPDGQPVAAVVLRDSQREVITTGLAPNEPAKSSYMLWGIGGDKPVALGSFDVAGTDASPQSVGSMGQGEAFTGYAISVEKGRVPPLLPTVVIASGQVTS